MEKLRYGDVSISSIGIFSLRLHQQLIQTTIQIRVNAYSNYIVNLGQTEDATLGICRLLDKKFLLLKL